MSALAWLFGLGVLATAFPFLFHLIRRTPKGQTEFSSLMFLRASPPRLTRRSRLENLLLLLLRMAAIAFIAAAFMRPYFKDNVSFGLATQPARRVAIMLDTSASMRRGDLWKNAIARVEQIANSISEKDDLGLYSFDSQLVNHVRFGNSAGLAIPFTQRLNELNPSWRSSDLGSALVQLADELEQSQDTVEDKRHLQIVVVSDMQAGSSTAALQNYQWPDWVLVEFQRVDTTDEDRTSATLELLPADESDIAAVREYVLVRNSHDSQQEQFQVAWADDASHAVDFYVPPGSSKILRVPRNERSLQSETLILTGDSADFDNQYFVVPPNQQIINVAYLGNESAEDPEQMLYYLQSALFETPVRIVKMVPYGKDEPFFANSIVTHELKPTEIPDLIVVTRSVADDERAAIDKCLQSNGSLFVVLNNEEMLESTRSWTKVGTATKLAVADSNQYAMLGQIDFDHPLFKPFAGPRLNDFTQIRFWKHFQAEVDEDTMILARFDNDKPAMWQSNVRRANDDSVDDYRTDNGGHIYVLACGWQPAFSQLALSSKFLPIINRMVEVAAHTPKVADAVLVGERIEIPDAYRRGTVHINGRSASLDPETSLTDQMSEPGVYQFINPDQDGSQPDGFRVAVNISPSESATDIMPIEQVTAYGVRVGNQIDVAKAGERQRKIHDAELESQQKLWKWLIFTALLLLIAETWLAGRTDRESFRSEDLVSNVALGEAV